MNQPSLAYRRHRDAIWHGSAPDKYMRLLPLVGAGNVLELGAAEGVLALLLAERGNLVFALERDAQRHVEALNLQAHWRKQGRKVDLCSMIRGDIRYRLDLLEKVSTFVAVRSIYYLREELDDVFAEIAKHVHRVVLCGNAGRARRFEQGDHNDSLGKFNYFASLGGMTYLLTSHGFRVERSISSGDPIVVGVR